MTDERCHYCMADHAQPVIGWLVSVLPSTSARWERPVCALHVGQGWGYAGAISVLVDHPEEIREGQPCGSYRVLRFVEGHEAETVWCDRRNGPCPFPATLPAALSRLCAAAALAEGVDRRAEAIEEART